MVLDKHRGIVDWLVVPISRAMRNVNPNALTWISLPFAIACGVFIWRSGVGNQAIWMLPAALVCLGLTSLFDLLDGKVARAYGKMSKKGDYLDHVIDRFADVIIFAGVAFSAWANLMVGFFAITGVLLTSYMGTQAQAVGIGRNYGGILGRADRLALLSFAIVIDWSRVLFGWEIPDALLVKSGFDAMLWWFAIAGNLTALQRFWNGLKWFDENPE